MAVKKRGPAAAKNGATDDDDLIEHKKESACYLRNPDYIKIAIITIRIIEKMLMMSKRD